LLFGTNPGADAALTTEDFVFDAHQRPGVEQAIAPVSGGKEKEKKKRKKNGPGSNPRRRMTVNDLTF